MPNFYVVALKHDAGILRLGVTAPTRSKAIRTACLAEHAPVSAVLACIKKAQIRRTK